MPNMCFDDILWRCYDRLLDVMMIFMKDFEHSYRINLLPILLSLKRYFSTFFHPHFFFFFWGALLDLGNEHWCTPNKFKTKSGEWFFTWAKRNHDICLNMSKEKPPHRFYMSKEKPRYRFYMSKETQRYCFYMSKEKPRYRFYMSKEQPRYHLYKSKEKPRYRFYKSKEKPQYRFYMSKEKPRYRFN